MIHDIPASAAWPLAFVTGVLLLSGSALFGRADRLVVPLMVAIMTVRYVLWRFEATLDGPGLDLDDRVFIHAFLVIELLAMFDGSILMLMLTRSRNNTPDADRHARRLKNLPPDALPFVDVFIATYNEPFEVLEKTIVGALALDWPALRVWVLDDGRRDWLRDFCAARDVGYLTRPDNKGAKAGNINAALARTDAPFVLVLDADFVPRGDFLRRTIGFFEDDRVGIVQAPHRFYNPDPMQQNLALHRVLPDDQRLFFDVIMPARDAWDAAFCCGSNGVIRRAALDAVGGKMPDGSITEDMLLSLVLLRKGFVTRYLNEPLALGLAPESNAAFFVQRARWARGAIQILYLRAGPFGRGLSLLHRLFFLPTHWLSGSLVQSFSLVAPVLFMLTGTVPIANVGVPEVLAYQLPTVVAFMGGLARLSGGAYHPLAALVLSAFSAVRLLPVVLATLLRPHGHAFRVTPKGAAAHADAADRRVVRAAVLLLAATIAGLALNADTTSRIISRSALIPVVAGWSIYNAIVLLLVITMAVSRPPLRREERFAMDGAEATLGIDGVARTARLVDMSLAGAQAQLAGAHGLAIGQRVTMASGQVPPIEARVVALRPGGRVALDFLHPSDAERAALIRALFSEARRPLVTPAAPGRVGSSLLGRVWLGSATARA